VMPRVIRVGLISVILIVMIVVFINVVVNFDCLVSTKIIAPIIFQSLLCIFIVFPWPLGYDMSLFISAWFNILAISH